MAERLTQKIFDNNGKQQDIYEWSSASSLECNRKLGKLEDILEKYGIEGVEELDFRLAFKQNDVFNYKVVTELEQERDTWKRACELACRHIAEVEWLSCPETDDISESEDEIKTLTKQSLYYFYQQAKKEKESESK